MIGALGDSDLLFGFFKDKAFKLLSSVELIRESDFGAKQSKKDEKRDMIGVFKTFFLVSLYTMDGGLG